MAWHNYTFETDREGVYILPFVAFSWTKKMKCFWVGWLFWLFTYDFNEDAANGRSDRS